MTMDPFAAYAKKALSPAPTKLIGVTKTRAEARAIYVELVGKLQAVRSLPALHNCLAENRMSILQIQAELEFLWFGDGADFPGLEREIEQAFETVEAAQFFMKFPTAHSGRVCEAGRLPGHSTEEQEYDS